MRAGSALRPQLLLDELETALDELLTSRLKYSSLTNSRGAALKSCRGKRWNVTTTLAQALRGAAFARGLQGIYDEFS